LPTFATLCAAFTAAGRTESGTGIKHQKAGPKHVINLCGMTLCEGEFIIDRKYDCQLRNKHDTFRKVIGTR
jgi:hypothetical protein